MMQFFNFAILHHATEIDSAMEKLSNSLKSTGLIFNEEYVGPARNQYSDDHLERMLEINADLPQRFRSKHVLRPPLANFRIEPSEAIHSDLVVSTFKKYFDMVYERNMNGGIAYQILWNNVEEFRNSNDPEAVKWLNYLIEEDLKLSKQNKVDILFWYGVGKPKETKNKFDETKNKFDEIKNKFKEKKLTKDNKSSVLEKKFKLNNATNKLRFLNNTDVNQIDNNTYSFLNDNDIKLFDITNEDFLKFKEKLKTQNWMDIAFDMYYETYPWLYKIITDSNRSDFLYLLNIKKDDLALDLGAGWGQISVPLSRLCDVVSLEGNLEKIELLKEIAQQENRDNIQYVAANISDTIFENKQFDLVILNGVLEWVGAFSKGISPIEIQQNVIQNAYNLLKPGGVLYIGIENKYGLKYLLGEKDDHSGLENFVYLNDNSIESFYKSIIGKTFTFFYSQ